MNPRTVATHDGPFHADEVTACALLIFFNRVDREKILRSRNQAKIDLCEYVCDVGGEYDPAGKRFDHHQADYTGSLSSAGMVLRYLHEEGEIDQPLYELLNNGLVHGVDLHDTGVAPQIVGIATFSHVISNMLPIEYHAPADEMDRAFAAAVDFALGHVRRMVERYRFNLSCRDEVAACMARSTELLLFERELPWLENFFELGGESHPALFVVMPAGDHWKVRAIPPNYQQRMAVRLPLPRAWAGLLDEELERISGIPGAIFCHKARFISVWDGRDAALAAVEKVLSMRGENEDPV